MSLISAYVMLQDCARQNSVPFRKFEDLEIGRWYGIDKFILIHSPFGMKIAVRIKNTAEYGGCFMINLPDRFKVMASQEKVDELNAEEDKGYMYYGGKDFSRKNRIIVGFEKQRFNADLQVKADIIAESMDVPY